jgi:OHCU decarboxylase
MTLEELNTLDSASAEQELLQCCAARGWAREMASRRPFRDVHAVIQDADIIWRGLDPVDWLEAFAAHPRIGDSTRPGGTAKIGGTDRTSVPAEAAGPDQWSAREQAGMDTATDALRQRLAAVNREYEDRFGFIYIVCATGKTPDEMLAIAEWRLKHSRDEELLTAAEEQRKITRIRLAKLIA